MSAPTARKTYASDVSDEGWAFMASYLGLIGEHVPQRHHDLRDVFTGSGAMGRPGAMEPYPARLRGLAASGSIPQAPGHPRPVEMRYSEPRAWPHVRGSVLDTSLDP